MEEIIEKAKSLIKPTLYGIAVGFLIYLLSGDGGISVGIGILVIYLEVLRRR